MGPGMETMTTLQAALDAVRTTSESQAADWRETHRELGKRRMQIMLLKEALDHFGQHTIQCRHWTDWTACNCGLAEALTIGAALATGTDVVRGASLDPPTVTPPPDWP